jgi:hypothetical protein
MKKEIPTLEEVTGLIPLGHWADRVGISRMWAYKLVWAGRLEPTAQFGRILLVPADMPAPDRTTLIGYMVRERLQRIVDEASEKAGEKLITQAELARRLGVTRQRAWQIIRERRIPMQRVPWDKEGKRCVALIPERVVKELRK